MDLEFIDISRPEEGRTSAGRRPQSTGKRKNYQTRREIERQRRLILLRKRRRQKRMIIKGIIILCELGFIILLCFFVYQIIRSFSPGRNMTTVSNFQSGRKEVVEANDTARPDIMEDFLTVNEYSRPGEPLNKVNNIFVHYTANQGTSAAQNRSYFENLGITGETSASAHFVIGYDGEIIQCIPLDEIAYAVQKRNYDSISIECCYVDESGKFTDATYHSLIELSAWLLKEYKLAPEDMMRHYDEGGKKCPLYYVENEEAWAQFLEDLRNYIMN